MAGKRGKTSNVVVWVLLALLVFALAGFGVGNFGGSVRSIGAVGDTEIDVNDYSRALQNELRAQAAAGQAVSLSSAQGAALAEAIRAQLLATAALDGETARLGLSVGDEAVRREVLSVEAFRGLDGSFDREAYAFTLRQNGLTEDQFEARVRTEAARTILGAALTGAVAAPPTLTDAILAHVGERRDVAILRIDAPAEQDTAPAPTEDDLRAHYEANLAAFTAPLKKRITYVSLVPEDLIDRLPVDEDAVRRLYEARADDFIRPERRLVERLVFPDQAAADAAMAALDTGAQTFEGLVSGRGLDLADADMGDVTEAELGEAGAAVFALAEPGVVGPLPTPVGPALFRVNAILAAQTTTFEEARDGLLAEAMVDRGRREIDAQREPIDDLLAGGATLEEIAEETDMTLGTLDFASDTAEGIAGYAAFRDAAAAVTGDDFPVLIDLEDGGIAALRLDAVIDPAPIPFDEARAAVAAALEAERITARLTAEAEVIAARLSEGQTFAALGLEPEQRAALARDTVLDGLPADLSARAFDLPEGGTAILTQGGQVVLIQVARIVPAGDGDALTPFIEAAIAGTIEQTLAEDVLTLFSAAIQAREGITLNQAAINAVHTQFP